MLGNKETGRWWKVTGSVMLVMLAPTRCSLHIHWDNACPASAGPDGVRASQARTSKPFSSWAKQLVTGSKYWPKKFISVWRYHPRMNFLASPVELASQEFGSEGPVSALSQSSLYTWGATLCGQLILSPCRWGLSLKTA